MTRPSARRVVVLGAGIVGLSCADALVRAGHDVTVCDPAPARGATHAAAGMLAPAGEAWFGEEPLLRLGLASLALWEGFAADLERRSGLRVDLRTSGTLLVGADRDDLAEVRRSTGLLVRAGVAVEELERRELRRREPVLGTAVAGGAFLPGDHQVNPRRVAAALLRVLGDRVRHRRGTVTDAGVLLDDGSLLGADDVVVATGVAASSRLRPVRGEVLRLRMADPPRRVLRAHVHGERVYLVPRTGGEVVVGATEQEHPRCAPGADPRPTVEGVARLLGAARTLAPGLDVAEVVEVLARDRPGSPDNGPLIGPLSCTAGPRQLIAAGHHRGGVLLAPVTAAAVVAHVGDGVVPDEVLSFNAHRFHVPKESA